MTNHNTPDEKNYFDLHTTGIGYVSRFREVKPSAGRRFTPFFAMGISALRGSTESPEYTYYDVKIVNDEALDALQRYGAQINGDDTKVLIGFRVGDEFPELYTTTDRKTNQPVTRVSMKGRLINLSFIKIKHGDGDYQMVYLRPRDDQSDSPADESSSPAPGETKEASSTDSAPESSTVDEIVDAIEESAPTITLYRASPGFEQSEQALKEAGYRYREVFDEQTNVWVRPDLVKVEEIQELIDDETNLIVLTRRDPEFDECYAMLKSAGYRFRKEFEDHENIWVRPDLLQQQPTELAA